MTTFVAELMKVVIFNDNKLLFSLLKSIFTKTLVPFVVNINANNNNT
jgi:hypothetical protein